MNTRTKTGKGSLPPIPADFGAWCEKNGITRERIVSETNVSDRQARRYMENDTPVRLPVWKAIYAFSQTG